jgi:Protein of unknown function (DUF3237)
MPGLGTRWPNRRTFVRCRTPAHRAVWLTVSSLAVLAASSSSLAQEDAGNRWPVPGVVAPGTELALELYVTLAPAVVVGSSDDGTRQHIPITGGRFRGEGIRGEVMAGGADWQVVRPDGVLEVNALYSIKTDDGAVIVVDNRGIIDRNADPPYVRTVPRFHAPQGKYDWLNKTLFVGTISGAPGGNAVIIRAFKVR